MARELLTHLERVGRDDRGTRTPAQPAAAIAALVVLVYALTLAYNPPRWPLTVTAAVIAAGFLTGRLVQRSGGRAAQSAVHTVAAVAALAVLSHALSTDPWFAPRWPLTVTAVLLGLGLVADPIAPLLTRRDVENSLRALAAVAAMAILVYALIHEQYFQSRWPLSVPAALLGLGLAVGRLAQVLRRRAMQRSAYAGTAIAAVGVLIFALATDKYFSPRWPLSLGVVVLVLGLIAGRLTQLAARPQERVLSERVDELSRTRSGALDVQVSELRRIERDLHDGAQARLVALSMKLGRAEDRYRDDPETAAFLREAREDTTAAIRELRELARGITPPVLADRGLEAAVRSLAQRSGADVAVRGELDRRPRPAVETAAYFVVAESLTNAAKHAAGTRVEVRLVEHGGDLFVEVTDFGPGGADRSGGGLTGLRQRVEALDGTLTITSPAGVGTQVEAVLPCGW